MMFPVAITAEMCYTEGAKVKRNRARDFYFPHPIPNQSNNSIRRKKRLLSFCGSRRRLALATKRGKVGAFYVMTKTKEFYVYLLIRPDGLIFYVGKGSRYRINQHEGEARTACHCRKCNTIRKIWREGGEVEKIIVFRTSNEQEAYDCEEALIKSYGRENLTNKSDGGEVPRNYSSEGRARIGEANKKRVWTPAQIQNSREKMLGKKTHPGND